MIYLAGGRLVLADALDRDAALLIEDGALAAIDPESAPGPRIGTLRTPPMIRARMRELMAMYPDQLAGTG